MSEKEKKILDRKLLEEEGKKYGIEDITDEEYERNCRFTLKTALTRILNERKGVAKSLKKDRKVHKGVLLGGRDFVYRGVTIENNKSQFITVLMHDEEIGEYGFVEHTIWGHLKPDDIKHGMGVEMEVEESTSTSEEGREFLNRTVRKVVSKKPEQLTLKQLLEEMTPRSPNDVSEDDLYEIVMVKGEISNVEPVPMFDEGQIIDEYPLLVNDRPSVRLGLKTEGDVKVTIQLDPARLSEPMLCFPDFMEIMKENDIEAAINSFVGREVVGIGALRRFQVGEPCFVTINLTALFAADEPEAPPFDFPREEKVEPPKKGKGKKSAKKGDAPAPPSPAPPPPPTTTKVEPPPKADTPSEEPKADPGIASKVTAIKSEVKDALEILGLDADEQAIIELKPGLKDVKPTLLQAIVKAVKQELQQ